ncbi:hypothetical protein ABZZ79_30420 [Streptomyces sp. NPDC006458]|uniref:hypothetical protein n=1 Tax=Streptomyces sp. NPDC006458 TaxID=3154302 RepID=UPI0033B45AD5
MSEIDTTARRASRTWSGHEAASAVQSLLGGMLSIGNGDAFREFRATARYIEGRREDATEAPAEATVRFSGASSWNELIGRTGALALRAAAPATRPERRAVLLDLLEAWAGTPFADPAFRFRMGKLAGRHSYALRDEQGASFGLHWPARKETRYFEVVFPGGDCAPRPEEPLYAVDCHRGWGTPEQLLRLVDLVWERGPFDWDADAVLALSEATGLSRPAAALVLSGNAGAGGYQVPFLDEHERSVYGFKAGELESARTELSAIRDEERLTLLADVLPEDPTDLWEPGGLARVADRTAAAWTRLHGRRPSAPWPTWQAAAALETGIPATHLCQLFLDPANAPVPPGFYLGVWPCPSEYRHLRTAWGVMSEYDSMNLVHAVLTGLTWAYTDLPAGDPVRDGAPGVVRQLRRVLAGGDSPARVLHAGVIRGSRGSRRQDWLTDGACDRILARITTGGLPPGRYESDPRACVPGLVAEIAADLDLTVDAAALYLQLLTLPVPSDRNVRRWNAWKPAQHKAAAAALVARGLVEEDRRSRAGRTLFLPGAWSHAEKPLLPMESWKAPLLGAQLSYDGTEVRDFELFPGTLPELFSRAWELVREGRGPMA